MRIRVVNTLLARRLISALALAVCLGSASQAADTHQTESAQANGGNQEQGILLVKLARPLDSGNLKRHAKVQALVSVEHNGMTMPRGSIVTGRVIEAKARSKGDPESALGIVFDKITPPHGAAPVSINGIILAIAPDPDFVPTPVSGPDYPTTGQNLGTYASSAGIARSVPLLNEGSKGVFGFKDLELGSGGILTSSAKDVKLASGTQILLSVKMH